MRTPPSLLIALTVSAGLHVLLLALGGWLPLLYERAPQHTRPDRLVARLQPPGDAAPPPAALPDVRENLPTDALSPVPSPAIAAAREAVSAAPDLPPVQADLAGRTQAPRFVEPPQFRALETYPLTIGLRLSVRLYVSRIGHVERVDVLESGPVPNDMLDAIMTELYNARLTPARNGDEMVPATLDLVIGAEEIAPLGGTSASPEQRSGAATGVSQRGRQGAESSRFPAEHPGR